MRFARSLPVLLGFTALLALLSAACGTSVAPTDAAIEPSPSAAAAAPASSPSSSATATARTEQRVPALRDTAWGYLVTLTNDHSPRESASGEELAAAEYLKAQFEALGYESRLQEFSFESVVTLRPFLEAGGVVATSTSAFPLTFSGAGDATARLVYAGKGFDEDLAGIDLEGAIVLFERGVLTFEEKVSRAADAGAAGVVVFNNDDGPFRGTLSNQADIPAISLSRERGLELVDALAAGDVTATLAVSYETLHSRNVVVEKPALGGGAASVVLGGHYDTVPGVPGANDNGSGIATLLAMAEAVKDVPYPFVLRFIAFGSEELGLLGSKEYVASLTAEEREAVVAILNFDALGTSSAPGILASDDLAERVERLADALDIGLVRHFGLGNSSSDHAPFADAGIPFVFFLGDDFSRIHTAEDTLDHVDRALMDSAARLAIALLDDLAGR